MKAKHINPDGFAPKFRKGDKVRGIDKTGFVTCLHDSSIDPEDGRESVETKEDGNEWYCDSLVLVERLRPSTGKVVEPAPMPTPMFTSSDTHDVKTEGGKVAIDPKMPLDTKPPVECFAPPVDLGPKDKAAKDFKASRVGVTIDTSPKISVNELPEAPELLVLIEDANAQILCLEETISHLAKRAAQQDQVAKEVLPPVMPKLKPLVWENGIARCELMNRTFSIDPCLSGETLFYRFEFDGGDYSNHDTYELAKSKAEEHRQRLFNDNIE